MSGRTLGPVAVAVIVLGVSAAGVLGVLAWNSARDEGTLVVGAPSIIATGEPTPSRGEFAPTPAPGSEPTPEPAQGEVAVEPTSETEVTAGSLGSFDFDDSVIEAAIVEGAANPLAGLPSRDVVATELLNAQLAATGVDLTGMEFTVFPASAIPSFVLMTTSDSTPLLGLDGVSDDAGSDQFLTELFGSTVLADFEVEKLIMQHSGTDEVGPFVMTITVRLEDLQAASEGADVFDRMAVQIERP